MLTVGNCYLAFKTVGAENQNTEASLYENSGGEPELDQSEPSATIVSDDSRSGFRDALETDDSDNAIPVFYQRQPPLAAQPELSQPTPLPPTARALSSSLFGSGGIGAALFGEQRAAQPSLGLPTETIGNAGATTRVTTDTGSLLGKSPSMLGIGVQRRTPIVNDPRVRGSRIGQLAASGSHWVPARIDLNTAVSQIDSHLVSDVTVVKGPYSVLFGPGLQFIDINLIRSPRFVDGPQWDASTSVNYKANGQQFYGREDVWGGTKTSGWRAGFGYANGNNYVSGDGTSIPSGYTSRDVDVAYGADLTDDSSVEVNFLNLGQNRVQYPGQVFNIDALQTNGVDVEYAANNQPLFDRLTIDLWYNRTQFNGNAQNPGTRKTFPFLDTIAYVGFTNVDSISTGYTVATTWGDDDGPQFTLGTDLRVIDQRVTEIGSGITFPTIFIDANSPVPASRSVNPGVFVQQTMPVGQFVRVTSGLRADIVNSDVTANPATLAHLGNYLPLLQPSLAEILGTSDFNQTRALFAGYVSSDLKLNEHWSLVAAVGSSERAPSLTEYYAAQPFMLLIQNGLNTVTGDPQLLAEHIAQADLGLRWNYNRWRGSLNGFHAWGFNYITFENIGIVQGPPNDNIQQTNLKYVNTDLATFAGAEAYLEFEWNDLFTPFATLTYVDARDRTRNGQFATKPVDPDLGEPSERVYGLPRGFFSGVSGAAQEPLPQIYPLQSRIGVRYHSAQTPDVQVPSPWAIELSARVVAGQDRIAVSLDETSTAGFTVWDLRGYWQPRKSLLLIGGIENFTNLNYLEHLDYRSPDGISMFQPGINGYVAAELKY